MVQRSSLLRLFLLFFDCREIRTSYYEKLSSIGGLIYDFIYNISNYNFSTFYGDNSFPWLFYSMAYDGFAPKDVEEFEQLMRSRKFPCGCIQTTAEKQYAAFFRGKNPGITTKGYKLAHIYSAGEGFNISAGYSKISDFCKDVFPKGINTLSFNQTKAF